MEKAHEFNSSRSPRIDIDPAALYHSGRNGGAGPRGEEMPILSLKRCAAPALFAACVIVSVVMDVFKPVPHGHRYGYAVVLSLALAAIWLLYEVRPTLVLSRAFLAAVLVAGLFFAGSELLLIRAKPHPEIVEYYASVFQAMREGKNPYTCGTIFHVAEFSTPVYGNFNYPPLEIFPYYLAFWATGIWGSAFLAAVNVALQFLACLILLWTFPVVKRRLLLPFFPLLIFLEIHLSIALTLLVTALILLVVARNRERTKPAHRFLIAALFGVGLMTKFLILPLMVGYYACQFDWKNLKSLGKIAVDGAVALAVAVAIMAPFGVGAVFRNTIAFNLILRDRAVLTTYFPNVLSGPFVWAGIGWLYPYAVVGILAASVLVATRLRLFSALMLVPYAFLLVAPVPERQYIPVILYIAVVGIVLSLKEKGADVMRRTAAAQGSPARLDPASIGAIRSGSGR